MKNILIILFTISCTSVSLFATESMPLMTVAAEKNRSSMQSIRLHGLKDLENTSFHFGSKKLTDQAPDLKKNPPWIKSEKRYFFCYLRFMESYSLLQSTWTYKWIDGCQILHQCFRHTD